MQQQNKGGFTLPGESGYEALTLELAERWGADVIRDSDGTTLSEEILQAGYGIYSTVCIIRDHNDWIRANPGCRQQVFLLAGPVVAPGGQALAIPLMEQYFTEQFALNARPQSVALWQVFDRTTGKEIPREDWRYEEATQSVVVQSALPGHSYTVNFLAWRIWEEISMYNHTTNDWQSEHLMQIDPVYPEAQAYMLAWMENWCKAHPATTVIRFTSLFYNFVWIWGSNARNRHLFTDWASYDFAVSEAMMARFEETYGYAITSEDFINGGKRHTTHMAPTKTQRDWMALVGDFVIEFGRQLVDIAHKYNKKAYVFYDDSWVGLEPYSGRFAEFGFDGLIKCVFSGFEARLCAGAEGVKTHELRLHPYLFPVGLGGAPSFSKGGNPTLEAKKYWLNIRRALLRAPIDRIGLGGYLHLTEDYPDFVDYIEKIAGEFRAIRGLWQGGKPAVLPPRIAVLTAWGALRSWTCSGHYHENPWNDLINLIESLSGLPFDVEFIDFEEAKNGGLEKADVVINAGFAGSAWSGGDAWNDAGLVAAVTAWVAKGGVLLGVGEPSATLGWDTLFRLAPVLGVDRDTGARVSHGRWEFTVQPPAHRLPEVEQPLAGLYLTDGEATVLAAQDGVPTITQKRFGKGVGAYMAGYRHSFANARALLETILALCGCDAASGPVTDNPLVECAWFPQDNTLVLINNSDVEQTATVPLPGGTQGCTLQPYDTEIRRL